MGSIIDGDYKALLKRGEFIDDSRDGRVVPFKIYHPVSDTLEALGAAPQKFPVILWSHGFGGNRDGAGFISRHLASHGYVIVHITHHGTDSSLWEGKPGHPWDHLKKTVVSRETTLNRFRDVPFALNQLSQWMVEHPDVGVHMDMDRLGISGHSFGAMTTQVMAGQMFPDEDGQLMAMPEPRFKAGILYSPVPISHLLDDGMSDEDVYGTISIPLLHMTGTDDGSPLHDFGYAERLKVYEHSGQNSGAPEKFLHVLEGGDHMIYNGTRGKLGNNDLREAHEAEILNVALKFWDAYLKDDAEAKAWLEKNQNPDL